MPPALRIEEGIKNQNLIRKEAFRVSNSRRKKLERRKRRILWRLRKRQWPEQAKPMFAARNIHYALADKARGLDCGGIGALQLLVRRVGWVAGGGWCTACWPGTRGSMSSCVAWMRCVTHCGVDGRGWTSGYGRPGWCGPPSARSVQMTRRQFDDVCRTEKRVAKDEPRPTRPASPGCSNATETRLFWV